MNKYKNIGIIACDLRQVHMAKYLMNKGCSINIICSEKLSHNKEYKESIHGIIYSGDFSDLRIVYDIEEIINTSQVIVTPIPFNKISEFIVIPKFISLLNEREDVSSILLYAGYIDNEARVILDKTNIKYIDYSKSEKLAIYNSIATAEGIIAEAILSKDTNLHGSKAIILGYGKCGKTLADKLKGLNVKVSICARREEELELANSLGFSTVNLHNLIMEISKYEYIFNTIPNIILKEDILRKVSVNSIILDIASLPGGVDKNAANKYNICVKHSLGIPGKYSPRSSGIAIAKDLLDYIQ